MSTNKVHDHVEFRQPTGIFTLQSLLTFSIFGKIINLVFAHQGDLFGA